MSFKLSIALLVVCLFAGCASPARVDQMTTSAFGIQTIPKDSPLKNSIGIKEVTGGKETNPMWVSNVSSSDFERALEGSLSAAGLLNPVRAGGRFRLTADLQELSQPMFGFDMTVTATVRYEITDQTNGKQVFVRMIPTPYTAKMGDAFLGAERLKIANEGAVRSNIEALIREISMLRIQVSVQ